MQAKELKQYILDDTDRIYTLLRNANFHDFRQNSEEIRCALPNMTNPTGVMIKLNNSLYTSLFELGYSGDLFGALGVVLEKSFSEVMRWVHSLLGLSNGYKKDDILDPLATLIKLSGNHKSEQQFTSNKLYDQSVLNKFVNGIHRSIIEEGITPDVARKFNIMYDPHMDRVIFPHFDWEDFTKVVGVQGRTTLSKVEIEMTGTPKYWNYIKHYRKALNLYGFNQASENVKESKQIILFEAEKSVLKQFTFTNCEGNSVALGGHTISDNQVDFILRKLPSDGEVILAFDHDVMTKENEGERYIINQAKKFSIFRKTSYIFDTYNILGEKDSPIDCGKKKWDYLFKWRKVIE